MSYKATIVENHIIVPERYMDIVRDLIGRGTFAPWFCELDGDGPLWLDIDADGHSTWHEGEHVPALARVAPYVLPGSSIILCGEDVNIWGYVFQDGKVYESHVDFALPDRLDPKVLER